MTERRSNEEREALIVDARTDALDPAEAAELALLADLLADPSTWAEPMSSLEDSIVAAVADAEPDVIAAAPTHTDRALRPSPFRKRIVLSMVAAAAAIVIVAGALAVVARRDPHADFKARLTAASALAPGASATAEIYRSAAGFHVTLDASGLPKLPAGEYYQAWLKNAHGVLVPIGSFSSSGGGVTLWSGVSPHDFPTLSVTIEAADGQQNSSGNRVLSGPVVAD